MIQLSTYDAKAKLSALMDAVLAGEDVIITRHGKPTVRLVPVDPPVWQPVWTPLPGMQTGATPDEAVAPVYAEGVPWSDTDPV